MSHTTANGTEIVHDELASFAKLVVIVRKIDTGFEAQITGRDVLRAIVATYPAPTHDGAVAGALRGLAEALEAP